EVVGEPHWVGREGEHLQLVLRQGREARQTVGFGMGALRDEPDLFRGRVDIAYTPRVESWEGAERVKLELLALRPTEKP
ncbi:MAG: hypothetical protein ACE5JJ_10665, partial [Nitrospinota bacterium]